MRKRFRAGNGAGFALPVFIWLIAVLFVFFGVRSFPKYSEKTEKIFEKPALNSLFSYLIKLEFALPLNGEEKEAPSEKQPEHIASTQPNIPARSLFEQPEEKPEVSKQLPYNMFLDADADLSAESIKIDNKSGLDCDIEALLNMPLDFSLDSSPSVLIVHTHTSESYTKTDTDTYEESDPYRTENLDYNVARVGEELKTALEAYGIGVIHDCTIHDYPDYNGAYSRSLDTINENLKKYPSVKIVIDLHRDAIANSDGSQYKTVAQVDDKTCSQILLVMGTDAMGVSHPDWRKNMSLALKLEYAMNTMYPSLAKPILLSQYRYNQDATTGSMILEVGCAGNTLDEALGAVRYFADAAAQVFLSVKK